MNSVRMKGDTVTEKSHILVVEDDRDLADMLDAYFRVQGYEVTTASWGEEAVQAALEKQPNLVVLDIRLPDIDGYEVCRRLRSHRRTQDIPVIFLTDKRNRADKLSGLELGVVDYITKPFDIQELRLRVRNALQRARVSPQMNPVTNLPEGAIVDEQLGQVLSSEVPWTILLMTVNGLDRFRELYGFVASDDVLRAVSLMINNSVHEAGTETDFIGHFAAHDFIIVTTARAASMIRARVETRLQQSMEYFYPLNARAETDRAQQKHPLQLMIGQVDHARGPFGDLEALKTAVRESRPGST